MLCGILMRALPRDIVVNYHRTAHLSAATAIPGPSSQPDRSELDRLLDFLSIEVESREKGEFKIPEKKNTKTTSYEDNISRQETAFDKRDEMLQMHSQWPSSKRLQTKDQLCHMRRKAR
ncbi:hypothetical protein HPB47_018821 [Ixodes persulcatus]|uniref:Uncharacterized protein n=1 Tax=Ixodes persulcatus TaxID=34615 RepID=A0AC60QLQ8_IXOPE|nr:hypothetical protein HPB47_018821 [Ixodes persulcatus]